MINYIYIILQMDHKFINYNLTTKEKRKITIYVHCRAQLDKNKYNIYRNEALNKILNNKITIIKRVYNNYKINKNNKIIKINKKINFIKLI